MAELSVSTFGVTEIEIDKRPLRKFRATKVQALLIYLLVQDGQIHQREGLMALFWPDDTPKSAQGSLRQTIHRLRQDIPEIVSSNGQDPAPLILADRQTVQINPYASYTLDVCTFKELLDAVQIHPHKSKTNCAECIARLKQAIKLYRGDFLADFYIPDSNPFEEWAMVKREALRRQVLDALDTLSQITFNQANYVEAQEIGRQHLAIDNLDERAYQQLMQALARSGQRHEALVVYETCQQLLADELGMAPTTQTTTIYEQIKAGELALDGQQTPGVRGYDLQEQIGAGSFGVVHKAVQKGIAREVAVKIIHPHYANQPEFIRRFEREAQMIALLEHPHIVPLYDFWRDPDGAYLVMRLLRGGNLHDEIQPNGWPLSRTNLLINQIATALHAAHRQGIIHRDVKPANILLDEEGNSYLSDFGIAKDLQQNEQLTQEQALLGSPSYVSPEQLLNEPVTDKTDQYSLGLVLYELLAGCPPFKESSLLELMQKQVNAPLPLLSTQRPSLTPAIDNIIQRATAKRPSDRFPDILAFAHALQTAATTQSGSVATPITLPEIPNLPKEDDIENPYKGLRPFQEADADIFFGREALVENLVARLTPSPLQGEGRGGGRFLAVVGPSGSGKSSVVKAGLLPAIRRGALPGSDKWFIASMIPGTHPLEELESALLHIAVNPPPSLLEPLQNDARGLIRTLKRILPQDTDAEEPSQLLLVIDQFEELFTLVTDDAARQHFLDIVLTAVSEPHSRLRVIMTLRADFYDRPLQQPELGEWLREHTELVLPLTAVELETAVTAPAAQMGVTFQPGLVAAIIADVNEQPGALPLLQYALTELFAQRDGRLLTHQAYQNIGGAVGALANRADEIYNNQTEAAQTLTQQMFMRLVTLGEGAEDTRRRVTRTELISLTNNPDLMTEIIDQFTAYRLLSLDHDPQTRQPSVEIAHEAILREWNRLRRWLNESRDDIRQGREVARIALNWEANQHDNSFLLRGARLEIIQRWLETTTLIQTPLEQSYIQQSLTQQKREQEAERTRQAHEEYLERRSRNILRALVVVFAVAALIAAGLSIFAFSQRNQAARQSRISLAQSVAALATLVLEEGNNQQELATLLALEAARINGDEGSNVSWLVNETLRQTLGQPYFNNTIQAHEDSIWSVAIAPDSQTVATAGSDHTIRLWDMNDLTAVPTILRGHQDIVNAVAFSPDGQWLASASSDDTIRLWDSSNLAHEPTILTAHQDNVRDVTFTPDGQILASSSNNGIIHLWDMTNLETAPLMITGADAGSIAFSPDGRILTVAGTRGIGARSTIRLWDMYNLATEPAVLHGHQDGVMMAAFSPDGKILASGDWDGVVHLRDMSDLSANPIILEGHREPVTSIAFSPDGQTLASGSFDKNIRLWDVGNPTAEPIILRGHETEIWSLAFTRDGRTLVSGDRNGVMRLWNVAQPVAEPAMLAGHNDAVRRAIFAPDGKMVASASWDNTIRLWDVTHPESNPVTLHGHEDAVLSLDIALDGQLLASAGADRTIRLWDLTNPVTEFLVLGENESWFWAVKFAPDGQILASADANGIIHLWDITNPISEPMVLAGHEGTALSLAFTPDGQTLASSSVDNTIHLWDMANPTAEPHILRGHKASVNAVTYSPDGQILASASGGQDGLDNTIRLWDMTNLSNEPTVLTVRGGSIYGLSFSPDGQTLAATSQDNTIRLWDMRDPLAEPLLLAGHEDAVWSVTFSPDGQTLASASSDETIRLWILLDELVEIGCQSVSRNLTADEWQRYVGSQEPYHPTCENLPIHPSVLAQQIGN